MNAEPADHIQKLTAALRTAAANAIDEMSGGIALIFVSTTASVLDMRLRAAAGFKRPDEARDAAARVLPGVREIVGFQETRSLPPEPTLGERARAAVVVHPLLHEGVLHGALVTAALTELAPQQQTGLGVLASHVALLCAHAQLEREHAELREQLSGRDVGGEDGSEEVLRLSEELFAQDIELLRSNEKLGKIERLKNDFIEKMSRELRTPLNSIIETIISVLTSENENLSEGAKDAMRAALDDGTAFLRTLQNILDLWRIKQGELPVEIQDVNLRELIDEAVFNTQEAIGSKAISIQQNLVEPLPRIRADLTKLTQILFLLLDNAAKFTPEGGIEIGARVEEGRLFCTVRDTGIGICPDDQQFIFDEFYQVDDPSSEKYRGAGLGLTLVRDLIVLLEGELSITSDAGRGTLVAFDIPIQTVV
ncbi:MAG: HAMP domain-containing histidine kinase [Myxococcales bacterium]|nr:HAMP domain-containing histidine kinase [Myxococcales bacterium]MDH5567192.1 HAMP domain-containing histidine kinase [Myxococcales bacterium]